MKNFVELHEGWDGELFPEICKQIREIIAVGIEEGTTSEPRKLDTEEGEGEAWWWVYRTPEGKYRYEEFGGNPNDANDVPYLVIWEE